MIVTEGEAQDYSTILKGNEQRASFAIIVAACSDAIEDFCGRKFAQDDFTEYFDVTTPTSELFLTNLPVESVTSVEVAGETKTTSMWNGRVLFDTPITGKVTVNYRGGFVTVPSAVKLAALHLIARETHRRQSDDRGAVSQVTEPGELGQTYRRTPVGLDMSTRLLVDPFRRIVPI